MSQSLVYGIGVNDSPYIIGWAENGKQALCPFYARWKGMLKRCYCPHAQKEHPTYFGCIVDSVWHRFTNFRKWMENEEWEGKALDKDLMGDGKLYSPSTCLFIRPAINSFLIDNKAKRGLYPVGVTRDGACAYRASIKASGAYKALGRYGTPEEAHLAWKRAKAGLALEMAEKELDPLVACGLREFARKLLTQ